MVIANATKDETTRSAKMRSREREDFQRKVKLVKALASSNVKEEAILEEDELSKMDAIETLEPEEQWRLSDILDKKMTENGLTEETQRVLFGGSGELTDAASSTSGKRTAAEIEAEEKAARARKESEDLADRQEAAARAQAEAATLAAHEQRMLSDPLYRQQIETILAVHHKKQVEQEAARATATTPAIAVKTANPNTSAAQAPPPTVDADYESEEENQPAEELTLERTTLRLKRTETMAETAIDMASQAINSAWIQIHCYLPRMWEPAWLSSELLHWNATGQLGREQGVAGMVARKTPATLFAENDNCAQWIQSQVSWLSGGHIRSSIVAPSEVKQQENQFKDLLNSFREQARKLGTEFEFSLVRPKRRPKQVRADSDGEGWKNDWWSIGIWSNDPKRVTDKNPLVLLRCEYNHNKFTMAYVAGLDALKELRIPRAQLIQYIDQAHTYYRYSLDISKTPISHVRDIVKDAKEEKEDSNTSAGSGMAQPVPTDPSAAPPAASTSDDAWQAYLTAKGKGKGKGGKKGGKKGKKFDAKGDKGKGKGKDGKGKFPYSTGGKSSAWSWSSHNWRY